MDVLKVLSNLSFLQVFQTLLNMFLISNVTFNVYYGFYSSTATDSNFPTKQTASLSI